MPLELSAPPRPTGLSTVLVDPLEGVTQREVASTTGNIQFGTRWSHELRTYPDASLFGTQPPPWISLPGKTSDGDLSERVPSFRPGSYSGTCAAGATYPVGFHHPIAGPSVIVINAAPLMQEAAAIRWLRGYLTAERIGELVGVSRQRIHDWLNGEAMTQAHRRRLLAVQDIVGRALRRHPTAVDVQRWLDTPWPPDGRTPAEELAAGELGRTRFMAMASPSSVATLRSPGKEPGTPIRDPFVALPRELASREDL